jgi:hypothetical protein
MERRLGKTWSEYRAAVVPPDAGPDQLLGTEMAFFGGASALFGVIMRELDPGKEPTADDLRRMDELHQEILDHCERVAASGAAPQSAFDEDGPQMYARPGHGLQFEILQWRPTPDGSGPPKQVHLHVGLETEKGTLHQYLRFKSAEGLDRFIADLQRNRKEVWP